jgi:hypothetical protein
LVIAISWNYLWAKKRKASSGSISTLVAVRMVEELDFEERKAVANEFATAKLNPN